MPGISRVLAIGCPHHPTKGEIKECVSEDKDGLGQRLGCPRGYTRRKLLKIWIYCSASKNQ